MNREKEQVTINRTDNFAFSESFNQKKWHIKQVIIYLYAST